MPSRPVKPRRQVTGGRASRSGAGAGLPGRRGAPGVGGAGPLLPGGGWGCVPPFGPGKCGGRREHRGGACRPHPPVVRLGAAEGGRVPEALRCQRPEPAKDAVGSPR